jgi:hypothetical protein
MARYPCPAADHAICHPGRVHHDARPERRQSIGCNTFQPPREASTILILGTDKTVVDTATTFPTIICMARRSRTTIIDQIRQAVLDAGMTRYEISKQTGIDKASLSRFVHGERGLSDEAINLIGELLDLEIVVRKKRKGK